MSDLLLAIVTSLAAWLLGAALVSPICYWMSRRQYREMRETRDAVIALMKQRQPITLIAGTAEVSPSMTVVNAGAVITPDVTTRVLRKEKGSVFSTLNLPVRESP